MMRPKCIHTRLDPKSFRHLLAALAAYQLTRMLQRERRSEHCRCDCMRFAQRLRGATLVHFCSLVFNNEKVYAHASMDWVALYPFDAVMFRRRPPHTFGVGPG